MYQRNRQPGLLEGNKGVLGTGGANGRDLGEVALIVQVLGHLGGGEKRSHLQPLNANSKYKNLHANKSDYTWIYD